MRPGREIDARVAQEIFGFEVWAKNKVLHEKTPEGERPLRFYSKEMQYAWPVAEKMRISLTATADGDWFAFAGPNEGWESPKSFLAYLDGGDFSFCGAAAAANAAQAICEAALKVLDKKKFYENRMTEEMPENVIKM